MNAELSAASTALTLPSVESALAEFQKDKLRELVAQSAHITGITNPAGRQQTHAAAMVLMRTRVAIEKAGKGARDQANAFIRDELAAERERVGIIEPEETRLITMRDGWDAEQKRIERERLWQEEQRKNALQERVDVIRADYVAHCVGATAAQMALVIAELQALPIDDSFAEYKERAQLAKDATLMRLGQAYQLQVAAEERKEQERIAREVEERRQAEQRRIEEEERQAREAEAARQRALMEAEHARQAEARQQQLEQQEREAAAERARQAAVREAQEADERRKNAIILRMTRIDGFVVRVRPSTTAAQIAEAIKDLQALEIDATFQEFRDQAADAKADALEQLEKAHTERVAFEREREEVARAERERVEAARQFEMRMEEIQGIQQQVYIATSGRLGVRAGGTIECIRDTLSETEAWALNEERFGGPLLFGMAQKAKANAVAEIRELLARAEERAREEATKPTPVADAPAAQPSEPVRYGIPSYDELVDFAREVEEKAEGELKAKARALLARVEAGEPVT